MSKISKSLEHQLTSEFDEVEYPATIRRDRLSLYPNYEVSSHWHDDVEFLLVIHGEMIFNVNGETIELQEEEGIFINARQVHGFLSKKHFECEYIVVRFHPVLLCATKEIENRFVVPVIENENYPYQILRRKIEWQRSVLDAALRVYYMRHETTLELGAQGQFFTMWEQIFLHSGRVMAKVREMTPQLSQLKNMISFIAENYNGKITLDDIRLAGNMGRTSCCLIFQKYLNQTPINYLTTVRVRKGAEMLMQTDMPIVDISYEVGFSGASYFAEAFKKHMGEIPSEYRKKRRGLKEEKSRKKSSADRAASSDAAEIDE